MSATIVSDWPYLVMQVTQRPGGRILITGHGEVDLTTADAFAETLTTVLRQERPSHVEVDLSDVAFMDSSGVNTLMRSRAIAAEFGCRITVSRPQPVVRRLFEVTGLLTLFGLAAR
jgi:anti-sigma B factor antagonist